MPENSFGAEGAALLAHAAASRENLVDAALAVAVARGERAMTAQRFDWRSDLVAEHVRLIRATGVHEFTAVEEQLIAERSPSLHQEDAPAASPHAA